MSMAKLKQMEGWGGFFLSLIRGDGGMEGFPPSLGAAMILSARVDLLRSMGADLLVLHPHAPSAQRIL